VCATSRSFRDVQQLANIPPFFSSLVSSGGFVGEHEAGQRLFQVAHDPRCSKSGVYWSWNGGPREDRGLEALEKGGQISGGGGAGGGWDSIYENDQSAKVLDVNTQLDLFKYATEISGAEWPELKQNRSPCPTLNVIGAVTKGMVKREELKRMRELGRPGIEENKLKVSKRQKVAAVADRVVSGTLSITVGRVARFAGKRVLGQVPEEALTNIDLAEQEHLLSSRPEDKLEALEADLMHEVAQQIGQDRVVDTEDERLFEQIYNEKSQAMVKVTVP
jgi:hypothetical protein